MMKKTTAMCLELLIVITIFLVPISCDDCDFFNNLTIGVKYRTGSGLSDLLKLNSFSDCIAPEKFAVELVEIGMTDQNFMKIGSKAVTDMTGLQKLYFIGCDVTEIDREAFSRLPSLREVQIVNTNLKKVPEGIFKMTPTIETLDFQNNDIKEIEDNAFSNLIALKVLILMSNNIDTVNNLWFTNSSNIEILDISRNQIYKISGTALNGLTKLRKLHLDYNEIEDIPSDMFKNFERLEFLGLSHNGLTQLKPEIFPNGIHLDTLLVNANYLNFLSKALLTSVTIGKANIEGNPWECNCLNEIFNTFYAKNVSVITEFCTNSNIPLCQYGTVAILIAQTTECKERVDDNLTEEFIETLRNINPPVNEYCAQLAQY